MLESKKEKKLERKKMKSRMRELLLFVPNFVKLLLDLLRDPRVSQADKAILTGVIMYAVVPLDIIPDFIPFIGQIDDSYLLAISIMRLLNRTDREVVLEHWNGKQDIKDLISNVATIAEYFLPQKMKNVLRGRIEPKGRLTVITDEPSLSEQG